MNLPESLKEALSKLPPFSEEWDEEKLLAQVMMVDEITGWEFYLCEYDRTSRMAYGLVKGFAIEYGPIPFTKESGMGNRPLTVIFDFKPEKVSAIRQRLQNPERRNIMSENFQHDVFISYATEDEQYASRIAGALEFNGIRIWFAPISLIIGDQLLPGLENGMRTSAAGILVISQHYIKKHWTRMEFDNLTRQFIEQGKRLLPIWHDVSKAEVENFSTTITGIVALNSKLEFEHLINNLVRSLSNSAPTVASIPDWENPVHRFKRGLGELQIYKTVNNQLFGNVFYVWDLLLYFAEEQFPVFVAGQFVSRDELLKEIADVFISHPDRIRDIAGEERFNKLREMCERHGYDTTGKK